MNNYIGLGIIMLGGFIAYKNFNNKNNSLTDNYDDPISSGYGLPRNDNSRILGILKDFTKPSFNYPHKYLNNANLNNRANNGLSLNRITDNLGIYKNSNNEIVGGISFDRKQSLTKKAVDDELKVINNPIVQISRNTSSSHHHHTTHSSNESKKSSRTKVSTSISHSKGISESTGIKASYENSRMQSTTLTKKQIRSFHYLTGGF